MAKPLDRGRLRKLLGMLGSGHDGEVLNAARRIDAMVRASAESWEALIPEAAGEPAGEGSDLERLDQMLASDRVSDVLKMRLKDMRRALKAGRLGEEDRRLLRVLHRKAVIDGAVAAA